VARAATVLLPVGFRGRVLLQSFATDFSHSIPLVAGHFDRPTRRTLMGAQADWPLVSEGIRASRVPRSPDLLQRATRSDFANYLPEDILVKVDRASMLNSLEVRAPLLDYRLIEFAFGNVPSHLKTTSTSRKVLLRRLAARLLPTSFDQERKQGFSIPLGSWLRNGPWRSYFQDILLGAESTLFDHGVIRKLLSGIQRGRGNGERLFALALFESWRRQYGVSI
jgi:asparagine synthase (glutamine-hydrolysing)